MTRPNGLLKGIAAKLSILMGGAVLATTAQATTAPLPTPSLGGIDAKNELSPIASQNLPAQLILKQQRTGFRMIAQHSSHSSHASHASHSSHSSHSSSAH